MHLKSLTMPKTWPFKRKGKTFTTRPFPLGLPLSLSVPLNTVFKDMLHYAQTTREVKHLLNEKSVQVNGVRKKDLHDALGLFDVLTITGLKEHYRLLLTTLGALSLVKISDKEATIKPCKIVGKGILKGAKMQLSLNDGRNVLLDKGVNYPIGDTVVLDFGAKKITQHLTLEKGKYLYIYQGKYSGEHGTLQEVTDEFIVVNTSQGHIKTLREYGMVIGDHKPLIHLL